MLCNSLLEDLQDGRVVDVLAFWRGRMGLNRRVGQINTSWHRLPTDATLHCVPWRKLCDELRQLATP